MNGDSIHSDSLKMWLVSPPIESPNSSTRMPTESQIAIERMYNNPSNAGQNCFPFSNGVTRITSEPIEVEEHRRSLLDGNNLQFNQKELMNPFRLVPPSRRHHRESVVCLGDTNASNVCKICGKWFRSRQQVAQHLLVHTDERRYKCSYCDRAFKQASHLQQHHRIHTGEKPYRCPLPGCSRSFPQLSNLNHHLRNHDKPDPPLSNTCVYCKRVYASGTVLRTHMDRIHLKQGDGTMNNHSDTAKPKSCHTKNKYDNSNMRSNMIKLASTTLPSMTVAPPVLNFSQSFLSTYAHELNFVQLPANFPNDSKLPFNSKMILPVSFPKENGGRYRSSEVTQDIKEDPHRSDSLGPEFGVLLNSDSKILECDVKREERNTHIQYNRHVYNGLNELINNGIGLNPMIMNGDYVHHQLLEKARVYPNQADNVPENPYSVTETSQDTKIKHSDNENEDKEETVGEEIKDIASGPFRYSYTLDNVFQGNKDNLVSSLNVQKDSYSDSDALGSKHGRVHSNNPWASTDDIIRESARQMQDVNREINVHSDDVRMEPVIREGGGNIDRSETVTRSQLDINTQRQSPIILRKHSDEFEKDVIDTFANGQNFDNNFQEVQSHSRKRKSFRPQRVVHEKVFVQDVDV